MFRYILLVLLVLLLSINTAEAKNNKIETIKSEKINMVYQLKHLKMKILNLKDTDYTQAEKYAIDGAAITLNFSNINKNLLKYSDFLIKWNKKIGIKKLKSETLLYLKSN